MSQVSLQEIDYRDFGKCLQLSNGVVDLVASLEFGPRIIRFGLIGKENEFCENNAAVLKTYQDKEWKTRGGHRLWHSPEKFPRTYIADNDPLAYERLKNGFRLIQPSEPWVQLQKEIDVVLSPETNFVNVTHHLINNNAWPVELSVWGITVMAPGGTEIIPQPQRDTGLLSNRILALWPYTKMNDPRIDWGDHYITLTQDPNTSAAFKFGIANEDGWAAYINHGNLFIKRYTHQLAAKYPDFGVSYETYTTDYMLEMESLSPLTLLEPEAVVTHEETWELVADQNFSTAIARLLL